MRIGKCALFDSSIDNFGSISPLFSHIHLCVLGYANSYGCTVGNKTEFLESATLTEEEFQERPIINWDAILFVNRPTELWAIQLILALISLTEALLLTYLGYKVQFVGRLRIKAQLAHRHRRPNASQSIFSLICCFFSDYRFDSAGKYLAANSFISFHIRVGNDYTICVYGKCDHIEQPQKFQRIGKLTAKTYSYILLSLLILSTCAATARRYYGPQCETYSSRYFWIVGLPSARWRICS